MAAMAAVGKNEDDESIKVVVRVRKLLSREADQNKVFKVTKSAEIMNENTKKTWTFDKKVFHSICLLKLLLSKFTNLRIMQHPNFCR